MDNIKQWIARNKKLFVLLLIVFAVFVAGSAVRCSFVQGERQVEIEAQNNQETKCEMTSLQKSIYSDYDKNTQDIVDFLKNSKWVDNSGNKSLFLFDSYYIERYNEKETAESYVICTIDTEKSKISSAHTQTINRITMLNSKDEYKNVILKTLNDGESSSSALISASLESEDFFSNSTIYNRISNTDSFVVDNWDNNANQFIQDKYTDLYNCIKNYCAKYYPQISSVSWSGLVTIDYSSHQIQYPFNVKTSSYFTLEVSYSQDTGEFTCYKAKS